MENTGCTIENGILVKYEGPGGDVVVPKGVTVIRPGTFKDCHGLKIAVIPAGIKEIPGGTFSGCDGMACICIPYTVARIGPGAFTGCTGLKCVCFTGTPAEWDGLRIEEGNDCLVETAEKELGFISEPGDFCVLCGVLTRYRGPGGDIVIPEHVADIDAYAFAGRRDLASMAIHAGVVRIHEHAFDGCTGLVIRAPAGSYAELYAKKTGIEFRPEPEQKKHVP